MINTGVLKGNPFPGIRPFNSAEDKLFFGREGVTSEMLNLLQENRFVALVGASASGKTSLIQSGVIPALITQEKQEWVPVLVRPGTKPVENLIRSFQQVFPKKLKETDVQSFLAGNQELGDLIIEKGLGSHNYCLVVDQFEELFRRGPAIKVQQKDPGTRRFVDLLVNATKGKRPGIYVLLSIRSDFIEASAAFRTLTELMNRSKFLLPQMSREALASAISGPVGLTGARLESGFVDYLLDELEEMENPLPQLQHALMRTWEVWEAREAREEPITIGDYQSVGTVKSAISEHLEEIFGRLDMRQKLICERLFKSITSKSEQYNGFKRQATLGNVARIAHCTIEELTDVVEVFRQPGSAFLSPLSTISLHSDSLIEISHEALIRIWDRLHQWVNDEHESINMYLKLSHASAQYQQGRTELWINPELHMAVNWRETQKPTPAWGVQYNPAFERAMVFLSTSEEELQWEEERKIILQKRRLMLNRSIAIFMGVLVVALSAIVFVTRTRPADGPQTDQLLEEDYVSTQSEQEPLSTEEQSPVASYTPEEETIEVREETTNPARIEQRASTTRERESTSSNRTRQTITPRPVVTNPTTTAQPASNRASELEKANRMQQLAKEVSERSIIVEKDPDLQGLLAYQAYQLNSGYKGRHDDVDIYNGLYAAMKKLISPAYNIYPSIRSSVKDIAWLNRTGSLMAVSSDGSVKILSGRIADKASQITLENTGQNNECVVISPDERFAAIGTNGGGLLFLELENKGAVVHQNSDEGKIVLFLSNLGKSGSFVSAGINNRILKWDYESRTASELVDAGVRPSALAVSANGQKLAYGTREGKVFELNVSSPGEVREVADFGQTQVKSLAYSRSGQNLVAGLLNGSLKILAGNNRNLIATLRGPEARVTDLAYSPDGRFLAAASHDNRVYLWSSSDWNNPPLVFEENKGFALAVCFNGNSRYFYSGSVNFPRLIGRPSESAVMASDYCSLVNRNLTEAEWDLYFGTELPFTKTCPDRN